MGAKVGREELCQGGGVLFCVSNERRYFALGDIDEGGIEGLAKGWSVAPFLLRENGGCPSRFMYGESCGFSGLLEGMRPCEGGFVLSAYFVGGDFGAEEATYGMEGGIG